MLVKHVRAGDVLTLTLPDKRAIRIRLADRKTRPGQPLAIDVPRDVVVDLERSKVAPCSEVSGVISTS